MVEMVNVFVSSLFQLFTLSTFSLMLVGIVIGFVVGILPGLGAPATLAIMLPFITKMNPFEAFAFLLGMNAVTNTTGDITSVLFGIPGEPSCVATIIDGHAMAKNGEAGRALGAVLMSSLMGATVGAFALAIAVPIVRPLVLACGSPEFFMLSVLGITFVASLSSESLLKGIITGGIGLLLATVGLNQISGVPRYTFGLLFLWDGVGLVPISVGLFAIPELIDLAIHGSIARERFGKLGGVMEGVKDSFRYWWLVVRCSAIGAFSAIIPGMGAGVGQFLTYAHALQSSPNKERFGKGAIEGVLGPGAGNNSTLGGSLITTVAFGVPASIMMALLMGAFLMKGIVPGPDMLVPEARGGHLALTFSFVWINVVSNIITVALCFLILNQLIKITYVRSSLIIPFILLLIYLGAFAEKNVFEDVALVLFFGGIGWVMQQLNWPRAPLILGLVLGNLAENRLFISISNYSYAWLLRPGVLLLIVLSLVGAFYPILKKKWQRWKRGKGEPLAQNAVSLNRTSLLKFSWATVFTLAIVVTLISALLDSRKFDFKAGLFPWAIGFPVLALSIAQLVRDIMGKGDRSDSGAEVGQELPTEVVNRQTARVSSWIIVFFVAIWLFGFSIGGTLCTFLYLKFDGRERWPVTLIMTAGTWVFVYGLFDRLLNVPFPTGQLLVWLKLA